MTRAGLRLVRQRGGAPARPLAARGFSLLEMLAASAIFAIIMVAVFLMYESNQRMFETGDALATAQQNARIALDDITAAIRMAGSFHPDPLCKAALSTEAVRIATGGTLSLHAGYRDPQGAAPNQDCNVYVTYTVWNAAGRRDVALWKERRCDPWGGAALCQIYQKQPLAGADVSDVSRGLARVTDLAFQYFDANGQSIPTLLPDPTSPGCASPYPAGRSRLDYALDGQGAVPEGAVPAPVAQGSQRDLVRIVRAQITIETNIAYDTTSGCYRRNVGGPTQAFTLVSEAYLRSQIP